MRTWITIICLGTLAGCFEEETQKPVLGPAPGHPGYGGVECYYPSLCDPGIPFDAGAPECFEDDGGFTHCHSPDDAELSDCFLDEDGFTHCPIPEDAGLPDCFLDDGGATICPGPDDAGVPGDAGAPECFVDERGLVHCPAPDDAGTPECFEPDGTPCGTTPDAGFDPHA